MNPLMMMLGVMLGLKRTCPRCRRTQLVVRADKHKTVKCKFCGAAIPPPKP
ncbi:MAG: 30S ribosomal protein S27 [Deltaproteobacteria bacterium]|nr:MAG: 30S ribosomal protein S27 [Deltaproteobacteria bacterium]